jgi:hypothetical protein
MSLRRLITVVSVVVVASGTLLAAPKKDDKKKAPPAPVAPAKDEPAAGSDAAAGSGSAVQMEEDTPPSDMNGTDENPDAPKDVFNKPAVTAVAPAPTRPSGYPIEEALRPVTLPANMSEISIAPHAMVSPVSTSDALRARYGITSRVQLGLTYVWGGFYDDPATNQMKTAFHPGKAVGVDVTVLLQNWLAVRVGVPVYIDPVAVGLQLGAPMKFTFGDKFALGGLDDLLLIKLSKFAPTFYYEQENATNAYFVTANNTATPDGHLRVSVYGVYNHTPQLAIIGRGGVDSILGSSGGSAAGTQGTSTSATFLRAGFQYSPRKYFDVGASVGFEDLAHGGTFSPQGFLALRI